MSTPAEQNAAIWQSSEMAETWVAEAELRQRNHAAQWRFMAELLPFGEQDAFTFLDLGAGAGDLSRAIMCAHPLSTAILADFSAGMLATGEAEMAPFEGRYRHIELDMSAASWPETIPAALGAVVTSQCVHHLADEHKQDLFAEIFGRLVPGGWYLNYDPVRTDDPVVAELWERAAARADSQAPHRREHSTPHDHARWENHLRHITPLKPQLAMLRAAGFDGVEVYWRRLDYVIFGGRRPPAAPAGG